MSTTTESAGLTTGTTEQTTTGSWELTAPVRRPPAKTQRQASEAESGPRSKRAAEAAAAAAAGAQPGELVYQPGGPMGAGGHMLPPSQHPQGLFGQHPQAGAAPPQACVQQHAAPAAAQMAPLPHLDLPHNPAGEARAHSPSPLDLFGDPFAGATNGQAGGGARGGGDGMHGLLDEDELLRIPSPPPLPAEWESAAARPGMLFDFDQFDINKRQQQVGWSLRRAVLAARTLAPFQQRGVHSRAHVASAWPPCLASSSLHPPFPLSPCRRAAPLPRW